MGRRADIRKSGRAACPRSFAPLVLMVSLLPRVLRVTLQFHQLLILNPVKTSGVTFAAFELRNIAQIQGMLECPISLMTRRTLPGVLVAKLHRMLKGSVGRLEDAAAE